VDKNNVVPIDQSTERLLARRQRRFHWLVGALTTTWLAVLVAAVALTPLPPLVPFAILAVLVVLAEHRFVLFGDETSMSGSMIVIVASVFVFADTSPIVGPLLIASLGGLYVPHLRARAWGRLAFNSTAFSLSVTATLGILEVLRVSQGEDLAPLSSAALASLVYWTVNNLIVAGHQRTLHERQFLRSMIDLTFSDLAVPFLSGATACLVIDAATDTLTKCGIVVLSTAAYGLWGYLRPRFTKRVIPPQLSVAPIAIWISICTIAMAFAALDASTLALSFATAVLAPRTYRSDCRYEDSALLVIAAATSFLGWPALVIFGTLWISVSRRRITPPSVWSATATVGVLATSTALHIIGSSSALPAFGEVLIAACVPWLVASLGSAVAVALRTRRDAFLTSLGVAIPSSTEVLLAIALAVFASVLASRPALAVAGGAAILTLWSYARFTLLGSRVHASR
jgi:hypothetical protein